MKSKLFSTCQVKGLLLKNRIVLSPMLSYSGENGFVTDWHFAHYAKFAMGGVGLVFVESTKVDPRGCTTPKDLGLWKDEFIAPMAKIVSMIHSYGAAAGIQLGHSGRKARNSLPWEGRMPLGSNQKGVDHGEEWELIGPSAIPSSKRADVPTAMTEQDIRDQVLAWAHAAERANSAGFDVLEIHGAHGYMLHQFLSVSANQRTDAYGGSIENRMRFPLQVVDAVRQVWPEEKPLFFRISSVDEAGWTIQDSVTLCTALKAHGVDVVDCSSGGMSEHSIVSEVIKPTYGYQVEFSRYIRREADVMTMAVGLIIHADQAEQILLNEHADLVAVGRELLSNPNWVMDAAEKLGEEKPFSVLPPNYGYWLEKRAISGFRGRTSTWMKGTDEPWDHV